MTSFTPQQIEEFLQEFFDVVGTRQYVGARYVPLFGRRGEDSIVWDNSEPYEPLTIVTYQGDTYTSRQYVPAQVDISNDQYWAKTGNFNAQVEQYRAEVIQLQNEWVEWKSNTTDDLTQWKTDTEAELDGWKGDTETDLDAWKTETEEDLEQSVGTMVRSRTRNPFYGATVIWVTDSWGANTYGTSWINLVTQRLHLNLIDLHQGSTGYIKAPTFLTRLTDWVTNNPTLVSTVDYIFVCGSCNDNVSEATIRGAIHDFVHYANVNFPTAQVMLIVPPMNVNPNLCQNLPPSGQNTWLNVILAHYFYDNNYSSSDNYIFNDALVYLFTCSKDSYFQTDNIHLTAKSYAMLARAFISNLFTGNQTFLANFGITSSTNTIQQFYLLSENNFQNRATLTDADLTITPTTSLTNRFRIKFDSENTYVQFQGSIDIATGAITNNTFYIAFPYLIFTEAIDKNDGEILLQAPDGTTMIGFMHPENYPKQYSHYADFNKYNPTSYLRVAVRNTTNFTWPAGNYWLNGTAVLSHKPTRIE